MKLQSPERQGVKNTMRRLRYNVAASLDGFIAGPTGEYDWIVEDGAIDFPALFSEFDLFIMGRKTFETVRAQGQDDPTLGQRVVVASRSLQQVDRPDVTVLRENLVETVAMLKKEPGKDIWLFGGSVVAGMLMDAGLVDAVEVALMPIVLREGIRLLAAGGRRNLRLEASRSLPSGIQMLVYSVPHDALSPSPDGLPIR